MITDMDEASGSNRAPQTVTECVSGDFQSCISCCIVRFPVKAVHGRARLQRSSTNRGSSSRLVSDVWSAAAIDGSAIP